MLSFSWEIGHLLRGNSLCSSRDISQFRRNLPKLHIVLQPGNLSTWNPPTCQPVFYTCRTLLVLNTVGYWRDLSGSGTYQVHAAFNNQKDDLNNSKSKISLRDPSWIIVLSFYLIIIPINLGFISPGSAEYLGVRPKTLCIHLFNG